MHQTEVFIESSHYIFTFRLLSVLIFPFPVGLYIYTLMRVAFSIKIQPSCPENKNAALFLKKVQFYFLIICILVLVGAVNTKVFSSTPAWLV